MSKTIDAHWALGTTATGVTTGGAVVPTAIRKTAQAALTQPRVVEFQVYSSVQYFVITARRVKRHKTWR